MPARVRAVRAPVPFFGQVHHLGNQGQRPVRRAGCFPHGVVQIGDVGARHDGDPLAPQGGEHVKAKVARVRPGAAWPLLGACVFRHVAFGQVRYRGGLAGLPALRGGVRAVLYPGKQAFRLHTRLFGSDDAMPAQGVSARYVVLVPVLENVRLHTGGFDPKAEAGKFVIPDKQIAVTGLDRRDGSVGEFGHDSAPLQSRL